MSFNRPINNSFGATLSKPASACRECPVQSSSTEFGNPVDPVDVAHPCFRPGVYVCGADADTKFQFSGTETCFKAIDDLRQPIRQRASAKGNRRLVPSNLAEEIESLRSGIQSLASTIERIAQEQLPHARSRALEALNEAEDALKRNPLAVVAIVLGVGFLIGVLTRR